VAAIRTVDTELVLRRCRFHIQADRTTAARSPIAALNLHARAPASGDRPPAVLIDACHFDSSGAGLVGQGPLDIQLPDCTVSCVRPAVWLDNGGASVNGKTVSGVSAELRLRHVSVIAGEGPVFRFEGSAPRVWTDDSVFAPAQSGEAILIAAADPDGLDWRG